MNREFEIIAKAYRNINESTIYSRNRKHICEANSAVTASEIAAEKAAARAAARAASKTAAEKAAAEAAKSGRRAARTTATNGRRVVGNARKAKKSTTPAATTPAATTPAARATTPAATTPAARATTPAATTPAARATTPAATTATTAGRPVRNSWKSTTQRMANYARNPAKHPGFVIGAVSIPAVAAGVGYLVGEMMHNEASEEEIKRAVEEYIGDTVGVITNQKDEYIAQLEDYIKEQEKYIDYYTKNASDAKAKADADAKAKADADAKAKADADAKAKADADAKAKADADAKISQQSQQQQQNGRSGRNGLLTTTLKTGKSVIDNIADGATDIVGGIGDFLF